MVGGMNYNTLTHSANTEETIQVCLHMQLLLYFYGQIQLYTEDIGRGFRVVADYMICQVVIVS